MTSMSPILNRQSSVCAELLVISAAALSDGIGELDSCAGSTCIFESSPRSDAALSSVTVSAASVVPAAVDPCSSVCRCRCSSALFLSIRSSDERSSRRRHRRSSRCTLCATPNNTPTSLLCWHWSSSNVTSTRYPSSCCTRTLTCSCCEAMCLSFSARACRSWLMVAEVLAAIVAAALSPAR